LHGKEKGSITVFFCLTFTIIVAMVCTIAESSTVYVSAVRSKSVSYIATESEMACYARELFEDYKALAVWDKDMEESLRSAVEVNNTENCIELKDISLKNCKSVTGDGADEFIRQIIDYEKYEIVEKSAEYIIDCLNKYKETEKNLSDSKVDTKKVFSKENSRKIDELSNLVKKCDKRLKKIKKKKGKGAEEISVIEEILKQNSESLTADGIRGIKKSKSRFDKYIISLEKQIKKAEQTGSTYETKRKTLLSDIKEEAGLEDSNQDGDVWDLNKKKLEDISNSVEKIKEDYSIELQNYINNLSEGEEIDIESVKAEILARIYDELKIVDDSIDNFMISEDDEEGKYRSLYETAKNLIQNGVLGMVVPDVSKVSDCTILTENLPSKSSGELRKIRTLSNPLNKGIFVSYVNNNFNCFTKPEVKDKTALKYELEYILNGKDSDKSNLTLTVTKILGIRQLVNNYCIFRDPAKITECETAATAISLVIGLPVLQPVIKILLIEAWALAESVWEVRELLKGNGIELIKTISDWKTNLLGLGGNLKKEKEDKKSEAKKLSDIEIDYEMYLDVLLMIEGNKKLAYRTMDLMQTNIAKNYNSSFKLSDCVNRIGVEYGYRYNNVFLKNPFGKLVSGSDCPGYTSTIKINYAY